MFLHVVSQIQLHEAPLRDLGDGVGSLTQVKLWFSRQEKGKTKYVDIYKLRASSKARRVSHVAMTAFHFLLLSPFVVKNRIQHCFMVIGSLPRAFWPVQWCSVSFFPLLSSYLMVLVFFFHFSFPLCMSSSFSRRFQLCSVAFPLDLRRYLIDQMANFLSFTH